MAFFKSGNPTLGEKTFERSAQIPHSESMTVQGTLNKFGILFMLSLATAAFAWKMFVSNVNIIPYMWGSVIGALIIALVLAFRMQLSPYLAPVYALLKGFAVGAISAVYNYAFAEVAPNIVMQAVFITFGVVIAMFFLYKFRIIRATETFKSVVITATIGVFFFYIIALALRAFGINIPFLHEGSTIGILFSLFVVGLAALNLILDFDMIEQGSKRNAPKFMEWYGAFGLLVTIVWLYLEILRLLSKFAKR